MRKVLACLFFFVCTLSRGQDIVLYRSLTATAYKLYEEKKYLESATKYNEAFAALSNKGYADDRYNAACSWAMAGKIDSAMTQLFKIAERTKYSDLFRITADPDLDSLHK